MNDCGLTVVGFFRFSGSEFFLRWTCADKSMRAAHTGYAHTGVFAVRLRLRAHRGVTKGSAFGQKRHPGIAERPALVSTALNAGRAGAERGGESGFPIADCGSTGLAGARFPIADWG